ncbi:hypothetical protein B0G74_3187 [Paraburkholderia sp. BL9I2N2]|nr:hypothetical protein B0G74_3187 [Paraburkholderia sp. BL9I2N2]
MIRNFGNHAGKINTVLQIWAPDLSEMNDAVRCRAGSPRKPRTYCAQQTAGLIGKLRSANRFGRHIDSGLLLPV